MSPCCAFHFRFRSIPRAEQAAFPSSEAPSPAPCPHCVCIISVTSGLSVCLPHQSQVTVIVALSQDPRQSSRRRMAALQARRCSRESRVGKGLPSLMPTKCMHAQLPHDSRLVSLAIKHILE